MTDILTIYEENLNNILDALTSKIKIDEDIIHNTTIDSQNIPISNHKIEKMIHSINYYNEQIEMAQKLIKNISYELYIIQKCNRDNRNDNNKSYLQFSLSVQQGRIDNLKLKLKKNEFLLDNIKRLIKCNLINEIKENIINTEQTGVINNDFNILNGIKDLNNNKSNKIRVMNEIKVNKIIIENKVTNGDKLISEESKQKEQLIDNSTTNSNYNYSSRKIETPNSTIKIEDANLNKLNTHINQFTSNIISNVQIYNSLDNNINTEVGFSSMDIENDFEIISKNTSTNIVVNLGSKINQCINLGDTHRKRTIVTIIIILIVLILIGYYFMKNNVDKSSV